MSYIDAPICTIAEKQKHENATKNTDAFLERSTAKHICSKKRPSLLIVLLDFLCLSDFFVISVLPRKSRITGLRT